MPYHVNAILFINEVKQVIRCKKMFCRLLRLLVLFIRFPCFLHRFKYHIIHNFLVARCQRVHNWESWRVLVSASTYHGIFDFNGNKVIDRTSKQLSDFLILSSFVSEYTRNISEKQLPTWSFKMAAWRYKYWEVISMADPENNSESWDKSKQHQQGEKAGTLCQG